MGVPCALCKSRKPHRTHVFPQNSRAEIQLKWVKALGLSREQESAVLAEMRQMEQKGSRPRWCTFHFVYDSAGIHFPKYFDPQEGKAAQGWEEGDEKGEEEDDEQGPSTKEEPVTPRDRSSTPNERRRSTRKKTATPADADDADPSSPEGVILDKSLQQLLLNAGLSVPGMKKKEASPKPSTSKTSTSKPPSSSRREEATSVEKTLQDILMVAGLPVPETLQAKTGVIVDGGNEGNVLSPARPSRMVPTAALNKITVGDAKRMGTFVPGFSRAGGATLSSPKTLTNPIAVKYAGNWPKVIMPKVNPARSAACYNSNTMERYDDSDALRNFKMPCKSHNCRSELTVIMNRARALEDQFDALSESVTHLVKMYQTKTPQAFRPAQNLGTVQGRAAAVSGPVYCRANLQKKNVREVPVDSLSVQERRIRKMDMGKDPEKLLTDDDLASTVRRRAVRKSSVEEEDAEDDESAPDEEYKPSTSKRRRLTSTCESSASEASPPRLEMIE